jgi:hypothetical protein
MKNLKTYDDFLNEARLNEASNFKTKKIDYTDLQYSDLIADGPQVSEISMVILVGGGGITLARVWSSDPKKTIGEKFFIKVEKSDPEVFKIIEDKKVINLVQPGIQAFLKDNK